MKVFVFTQCVVYVLCDSVQPCIGSTKVRCVPNYHKVGDTVAAAPLVPTNPAAALCRAPFCGTVQCDSLPEVGELNSLPGNGKIM